MSKQKRKISLPQTLVLNTRIAKTKYSYTLVRKVSEGSCFIQTKYLPISQTKHFKSFKSFSQEIMLRPCHCSSHLQDIYLSISILNAVSRMNAIFQINLKSVRRLPPNFEQHIFINIVQNYIGFCHGKQHYWFRVCLKCLCS